MAKQLINLGSTVNDGTGDPLRTGAQKINANFTELYNALTSDGNTPVSIVNTVAGGRGLVASNPSGQVTVSANIASPTTFGVIKIGTGLNMDEDGVVTTQVYSLPTATNNTLGGIRVGDNLTIDNFGTLSAIATPYTLPTASSNVLGGIKIGAGLSINQNGVVSVSIGVASALSKDDALIDLVSSGLDATLKSSGSLTLLAGDNGTVADNNLILRWGLDINDPVNSKNTQILIGDSGANIIVGEEGDAKFWNFNHSGVLTLPETILGTSWINASAGSYPMIIAGFNNGENGGPELNWANNGPAQDPFNSAVTRNSLWVNTNGVVFSLNANDDIPTQWQFKTDKSTVFPGTLTLTGDPTAILASISNLESFITGRNQLIAPLEAQVENIDDQLLYWNGIYSQGPSNPLFSQSISQLSFLSSQKSSIVNQISIYELQIASAQSAIDGYEVQLEVTTVNLSMDPVVDSLVVSTGIISGSTNTTLTAKNSETGADGGHVTIKSGYSQFGDSGNVYIQGANCYSNSINDQGTVYIQGGDNLRTSSTAAGGDVKITGGKSSGSTPSGTVYISGGPAKNDSLGSDGGDVYITGGYRYGAGPDGFADPGSSENGRVYIGRFYTKSVEIGGNNNSTVTIATGNSASLEYDPDHVWKFDLQGRMQFPTNSSVPATSKGSAGDTAGMVAIDASYIYYCTTTYTNGVSDIWKRTPHASGTW